MTRIPDERLPNKVPYGELRKEDTLKASLKDFNIPTESCKQAAYDRTKWRCLIRKGVAHYEARKICEAEQSAKTAKKKPRDHHQSRYSPSLMLFLQPIVKS